MINQQGENKIFRPMCHFSDPVVELWNSLERNVGKKKFSAVSNIDLVLSDEKLPVEKVKMTMPHATAGIQYFNFISLSESYAPLLLG